MSDLKLYACWPLGAFGDVTIVVAPSKQEAIAWLESFFGESFAELSRTAEEDFGGGICIEEHAIVEGLIHNNENQGGVPQFYEPHAAI